MVPVNECLTLNNLLLCTSLNCVLDSRSGSSAINPCIIQYNIIIITTLFLVDLHKKLQVQHKLAIIIAFEYFYNNYYGVCWCHHQILQLLFLQCYLLAIKLCMSYAIKLDPSWRLYQFLPRVIQARGRVYS